MPSGPGGMNIYHDMRQVQILAPRLRQKLDNKTIQNNTALPKRRFRNRKSTNRKE